MEHGAHHVHDHQTDPQDMRHMGGLRHKIKATFWAYLAGALALVGIFPFAGFWSKDEILAEAFLRRAEPFTFWVFSAGMVGAIFTAFYMGRQIGLVFSGKPRTEMAAYAAEPGRRMTWPLLVLAFFAVVLGFINVPQDFPLIGPLMGGWLHGLAGEVHLLAEEAAPGLVFEAAPFNWAVAISASLISLLSFGFGWWLYARLDSAEAPDPIRRLPRLSQPLFTLLFNKYYIDEIYRGLLIYPVVSLATFWARFDYDWVINPIVNFVGYLTRLVAGGSAIFDQYGLDGYLVNGIPSAFYWFGGQLRLLQTGRLPNYLLIFVVGLLILIGIFMFIWSGQGVAVVSMP